jgi:hypothetical protein
VLPRMGVIAPRARRQQGEPRDSEVLYPMFIDQRIREGGPFRQKHYTDEQNCWRYSLICSPESV